MIGANFQMIPKYVKFLILQNLSLGDLSNFFLTCKDTYKIYKDETFWSDRLKKHYPQISLNNHSSFFKLYKTITMRYGQLYFVLHRNDGSSMIVNQFPSLSDHQILNLVSNESTCKYIINDKNQLILFRSDVSQSLLDVYLKQRYDLKKIEENPILINIKNILNLNQICLLLTSNHNLYELVPEVPILNEIDTTNFQKIEYKLNLVAKNIREIGGNELLRYYITWENQLYVKSKNKFVHVDTCQYVFLKNSTIYYLKDNDIYKYKYKQIKNVYFLKFQCQAFLYNQGNYYFLDSHRHLHIINKKNGGSQIHDKYIIDKIFVSKKGICLLTTNLDLYHLYRNNFKLIETNVLNFVYNSESSWIIKLII